MMTINVIKIPLLADISFSAEKNKTDTNIKTQWPLERNWIRLIYVHIVYIKASNGICKCTYILPSTKMGSICKREQIHSIHSLLLNISSEEFRQ